MSTHILENSCIRVTVSDAGAELCSVVDKSDGSERIWTADPAVWNRHAPILFPFVGRVAGGVYRIGDQEYAMKTQHGFARDMDFLCTEEDESSVTHCLTPTPATRKIYPYEFRLTVKHSLDPAQPRTLHVDWTVENQGSAPMYYAIGAHPGFLLPPGTRKEDCSLAFPGKSALRFFGVESPSGLALPEQETELPLENGEAAFRESIYDTWIFQSQQVEEIRIVRGGTPLAVLRCPGFPLLAVWANPKGSFICLEPWFGRTDDKSFSGTLAEKPGEQLLPAGGSRTIRYSMDFPAWKPE